MYQLTQVYCNVILFGMWVDTWKTKGSWQRVTWAIWISSLYNRKLWQTITNHCQSDYHATLTLFEGFLPCFQKRLSKCLCFSRQETYSWTYSTGINRKHGVPLEELEAHVTLGYSKMRHSSHCIGLLHMLKSMETVQKHTLAFFTSTIKAKNLNVS